MGFAQRLRSVPGAIRKDRHATQRVRYAGECLHLARARCTLFVLVKLKEGNTVSNRWTQDDISLMAGFLTEAMHGAGIIPAGAKVYISPGSPLNGRGWKMTTGLHGEDQVPGFPEYLGWTGGEAHARCRAMLDTFHAVKAVARGEEWHARRRADIADRLAGAAAVKVGA